MVLAQCFEGAAHSFEQAVGVVAGEGHGRTEFQDVALGTTGRDEDPVLPEGIYDAGGGFFIGVDLVTDRSTLTPDGEAAAGIVNTLREDRILISACGAQGNVLKLRPPMPFSSNDADRLLEGIGRAFKALR